MTRSWLLTCTSNAVIYNVWALIAADSSFTDPTFTTAPFVPNMVCESIFTANGGAVSVYEDSKQEVGTSIPSGATFTKRTMINSIDLKSMQIKHANNGGTVSVSITAL